MHTMAYFHDIAAVRGRFNAYVGGVELETGYAMGKTDDNFTLRGGLSCNIVLQFTNKQELQHKVL